MKKKEWDIHIIRITTNFGCQQVRFLIFPNLIRQPAAIVKTKIEVFIKNIDIAISRNWHIHRAVSAISNMKTVSN